MVISAFIGLIGLGPASRVFTCSLLDRLLTATTNISICYMTSYSNTSEVAIFTGCKKRLVHFD